MWKWPLTRKPSAEAEAIRQLEDRQEEASAALGEQLTKLTRLQFKSSQELSAKLDKVSDQLAEQMKLQPTLTTLQEQLQQRQQQLYRLQSDMMRQVDDFDALQAQLKGEEGKVWQPLFKQWSTQLLEALAAAGVHEIPAEGQPFDSRWAESVGTVSREQLLEGGIGPDHIHAMKSYQIVEVIRRGFASDDGTLIRKAMVITLAKENNYDE
ncbi:nucleotide exchange factor GrpE [Paenibacillus koleovorans]|uniref:nucleotide exchange factor GrpE n=1 Tax=Paenibacillus koleovorans TaxID=121608 RepID=UPI000FD76978|nr:nucleotide exchange factor GrpE [Paenibacillus koleovorans]